jgi:aquaporin Z
VYLMARKLTAEFIGTFALVFLAVGAAITGIKSAGPLSVALAFGLVLTFGVYAFGPVSGCHVNPAVTLGMVVARKLPLSEAVPYWVTQFVAATAAAALLKLMTTSFDVTDETGALGTNGYGTGHGINLAGAFVVETVLTLLFVLVILLVTDKAGNAAMAGVAIGTTLAVVHLVGIPLTGTSVNPARSFGPALFEGGTALSQLWLFIVAPLVGGALAALVYQVARKEPSA